MYYHTLVKWVKNIIIWHGIVAHLLLFSRVLSLSNHHGNTLCTCAGSGSLVAMLQVQAQVEQLQVAVGQAESRRRSAEARASEAEREVEELTVRVTSLQRRERQAVAALADAAVPQLEPSASGARLRAKVIGRGWLSSREVVVLCDVGLQY
jgi:membrane protein involved in colicin uptake